MPRLISETRRTVAKRRSFSGSGRTMARMSSRLRGSKRTIQSTPPASSLTEPAAADRFLIHRLGRLACHDGLVQTGRQDIDQVDVGGKFLVLLLGDAAR